MESEASTEFRHVDVFADRPFSGNGLVVFFGGVERTDEELLAITGEMRQFESVFINRGPEPNLLRARIFTVEEELGFAGHPIIGAAAAAHERWFPEEDEREWSFLIGEREVEVRSGRSGDYFDATMNQGRAVIEPPLDAERSAVLLEALGLSRADQDPRLPLQVVSTGLDYLIVPVTAEGLAESRIEVTDFEAELDAVGAKFVYVFDPDAREGRTWDNAGAVEDVATGSAAGPAGAYLIEHGLVSETRFELSQGRFVGRPSSMSIEAQPGGDIWVGGPVAPVARGTLDR